MEVVSYFGVVRGGNRQASSSAGVSYSSMWCGLGGRCCLVPSSLVLSRSSLQRPQRVLFTLLGSLDVRCDLMQVVFLVRSHVPFCICASGRLGKRQIRCPALYIYLGTSSSPSYLVSPSLRYTAIPRGADHCGGEKPADGLLADHVTCVSCTTVACALPPADGLAS